MAFIYGCRGLKSIGFTKKIINFSISDFKKTLVFTKSIENCHLLYTVLKHMNFNVAEISSKLKFKRTKILKAFKNDKIEVLVSTDALARGIDIGTIDFVISYDVPSYVKTYIHRIGKNAL